MYLVCITNGFQTHSELLTELESSSRSLSPRRQSSSAATNKAVEEEYNEEEDGDDGQGGDDGDGADDADDGGFGDDFDDFEIGFGCRANILGGIEICQVKGGLNQILMLGLSVILLHAESIRLLTKEGTTGIGRED